MDDPFDTLAKRGSGAPVARRGAIARAFGVALGILAGQATRPETAAKKRNKHRNRKRKKRGNPPPGCARDCAGKECGGDGCGGSCGSCPSGSRCSDPINGGVCQAGCARDCGGKNCGSDGCGGSCGTCSNGFTCSDSANGGTCQCPAGSCGGVCCAGNQTCVAGSCCATARVCGTACCAAGTTCLANQCCPDARVCGSACCATGQSCVGGSCRSNTSLDAEESAFVTLINDHRRANGRNPLAVQSQLTAAAERHAQDMAATGITGHTGSDGSTPDERIEEAGYEWSAWGENVFWHSSDGSANAAFTWWRNSPDHNRNMLSANFTEIGIARVRSNSGRWNWTTTFGRPG